MVPFFFFFLNVNLNRICCYLVNEGDEAVVETLNLLLLLVAYSLDSWVNIYLHRHQQVLVDGHGLDRGHLGGPIAGLGDAIGAHGSAAEAGGASSRMPRPAAHTCGGGDLTARPDDRRACEFFNL